jgi:hypothetical protein
MSEFLVDVGCCASFIVILMSATWCFVHFIMPFVFWCIDHISQSER